MADAVQYRLSTLDQGIIRTYQRVCLCFPCSNEAVDRQRVADALTANLTRTVKSMPILAGAVYPSSTTTPSSLVHIGDTSSLGASRRQSSESAATAPVGDHITQFRDLNRRESAGTDWVPHQRGCLEVCVETADLRNLKPTLKFLDEKDFSPPYSELAEQGMPASAFMDTALTPLPDMPDPAEGSNPAIAVQASFIDGGVFVAIYVHHSIADIIGVATIIRSISTIDDAAAEQEVSITTLQEDSQEQSRSRDRLSGPRGVKASAVEHPEYHTITGAGYAKRLAPSSGACHVLSFDLEKLQNIRTMILERFHLIHDKPQVDVSVKDCLAAVLWKSLTRARWVSDDNASGQPSSMLMPVNIRAKVDPALDETYYGNATLYAHNTAPIIQLCLPFDVGTLSRIAHMIHSNILCMTETKVRSAIALINEREDVRSVNHPVIDFNNDVFITDWSDLPVDEKADLGLGLGPPEFVRKVSRQHSSYGCVLLPAKPENNIWEVLVQMTDEAMERLLEDPGLMPLLRRVA